MDVLVLIDKLDDTIHNAKPVPLTDQVRVDKEEIYDILDQMRATIPEEIKQARWIVKERQEMLAEAKREAERIVKEARERGERLVSEEEITKQAERAAEDIIEDARARHSPTAGAAPGGGDAWPDFRATVADRVETLRELIDLPVQTNEVGRCAALLGGFLEVARTTGLPLAILEVGSSGGLNLHWD